MDNDVLKSLGKALFEYYLDIYHDSSCISLFIDRLTFEEVCKSHGLCYEECMKHLNHCYPSISASKKPYISLAIVAFQIMLTNDVENDGVYDKLRAAIQSLRSKDNTTLMKDYFENGQDHIWKTVRDLFKKKGKEINKFPQKTVGPGRYVQYPISQQLMKTSDIIKYADIFKKTLFPHSPYSFEEFKKRVHFLPYHNNDLIKHLLFSFYQSWNGQSTRDYKRNRDGEIKQFTSISKGETVIVINKEAQSFRIVQYGENNEIEIAPEKLLSSSTIFRVFKFNSDFQDWSMMKINNIPQESEYLGLLTSKYDFETIKQKLPNAKKLYYSKNSVFVIFESKEHCRQVQNALGIERESLSFWLSGGMRLGYNEYSDEALPILCFKNEQKEIYINSKKVEFKDGLIKQIPLKEILPNPPIGEFYIKLPYCAALKISVSSFTDNTIPENQELLGFSCSSYSIKIYEQNSKERLLIRGLKVFTNNKYNHINPAFTGRGFIQHKQSFERNIKGLLHDNRRLL